MSVCPSFTYLVPHASYTTQDIICNKLKQPRDAGLAPADCVCFGWIALYDSATSGCYDTVPSARYRDTMGLPHAKTSNSRPRALWLVLPSVEPHQRCIVTLALCLVLFHHGYGSHPFSCFDCRTNRIFTMIEILSRRPASSCYQRSRMLIVRLKA